MAENRGRAGFKYPNKTDENLILIRQDGGRGRFWQQTGVRYRDHNLIIEDDGNNRR